MKTKKIKGYVECKYGQIHFQSYGSGQPLVLCHQSPSSLEMFAPAYSLLENNGIQAIGIDTPGYGQSDEPDTQPSIKDYAECIAEVINYLGCEPVSILGHHTGACIAAELSLLRPDLISRVILNGPPVMTTQEKNQIMNAIKNAPKVIPKKDGSHLKNLWEKRISFTPGWTDINAMHNGVIQMLRAGANDHFGFIAAFEYDLENAITKIKQPTMILTNTGDDIYFAAIRAKELRSDFVFTALIDGTHDIVDEQTNEWVDSIVDFIKKM